MKYFQSPEGNLIFSAAIVAENTIQKLEKKFEKTEISAENYVAIREKLLNTVQQFKNYVEKESTSLSKKSFHQTKTRRKKDAK